MSLPYSTPSTPLHRPTKQDNQFSNYTAPARSKVYGIPLPPHQLPDVISEISLRRPESTKIFTSPNSNPQSAGRLHSGGHNSTYGSKKGSNVSSRPNTPTRRLSSHLSIRRRRRSSTGVLYDSAYAGKVTKDFLRDMSKALVREKQDPTEEPSDKVFKALDQQFRLKSISPNVATNDFDYSLPLPSDNDLMSSDEMVSHGHFENVPPKSKPPAKPAFKSYLERIIALRSKKTKHSKPPHSIFDLDSPDSVLKHELVNDSINTSRFVIENTLSGLTDVWNKVPSSDSTMKLAEPVAFGSMNDVNSSNESSEKETLLPPPTVQHKTTRSSQISLGNFTPDNYDNIYFEKINQLDVPNYEPIPFYDHDNLDIRELNEFKSLEETPDAGEPPKSDPNETEMIQGHFTIDDDNLDQLDPFSPNEDFNLPIEVMPTITHNAAAQQTPIKLSVPTMKRKRSATSFPNTLVKGFASIAQNISSGNLEDERAPKRRKRAFNSSLLNLIAQKSEEFLENVMCDLTAYAEHRNSYEVNISDAVLYFNRIQSFDSKSDGSMNFAATSRSIFPLECLQSLDNSLQASALKFSRNRENTMEIENDPTWMEDEDSKELYQDNGYL